MKAMRAMLFLTVFICASGLLPAQLAQLPKPFATPSVRNSAQIVAKPASAQLKAPAGFTVSTFADDVQGPRTMVYAPKSTGIRK